MGKGIVKLGEGNWAVKDGNLLAAKETNGRFKNAEFTVARGTRATYVGRDGLIKDSNLQDVNLVTNGTFDADSDWVKGTGWSISNGSASYDGSGGTSSIGQSGIIESGKTYKITLDVLSNEGSGNNTIYLGGVIANNAHLETGSYTFYVTTSTTGGLSIFGRSGENFSIDNVSVQEVKTDTPRIDFTDNTDGHLLLEPQSTNIITYSEDFSEWSESNATTTSNSATSPSGLLNADKVIASNSNSTHAIFIIPSVSASTTYTFSLYAKADEYERLYIRQGTGSSPSAAIYELSGAGSVLQTYGSPLDEGINNVGNGWYRITLTNTTSASTPNFAPNVIGIPNSGYSADEDGVTFLGDGTSGVYIWGAQLEALPYATSYIPTNGSTVTRDGETCTGAGEAIDFNSEEGVLYAEIAALETTSSGSNYITITDGTYNNRASILFSSGATNQIRFFLRVGGASQVDKNQSVTNVKSFNKVAFKYKANDFAVWINGVEVSTDTSGSVWTSGTINELNFSEIGTATGAFRGKLKALKVYKEALSDADLQNLTS